LAEEKQMIRIAYVLLLFSIVIYAVPPRILAQVVSNDDIEVPDSASIEDPLERDDDVVLNELRPPLMDANENNFDLQEELEDLPDLDGVADEDLPRLSAHAEEAHAPSKIHVLKTKHVNGLWACTSLKDVFEEEIASGACRLTSAENLVIVRTRDPNLLEKIHQLLGVLDVPVYDPRQINELTETPGAGKQSERLNDIKTHALVDAWHAAPASEREEIAQSLEQHIEAQFEARQQRQQQQINQLRQRLSRLESSIERRIENRSELIQQTIKKLLSGASANRVSTFNVGSPKDSPNESPSSQSIVNAPPRTRNSSSDLPSVGQLKLLRTQVETAEASFSSGTLPHMELLRAQTKYQSAVSAVRQNAAALETELQLCELDLEEATQNYESRKHEAEQLQSLGRDGTATSQAVRNARDQARVSFIDFKRARVQLEAARRKWEAFKMVQESLDTPSDE